MTNGSAFVIRGPALLSSADMAIQIAIPHRAGKLSVQWPGNDPEGCARLLRELLK